MHAFEAMQPHQLSHVYVCPKAEDTHQAHIIERVSGRQMPQSGPRAHVGVAGFFNADIAAHTRPDAMVLIDINRHAVEVWKIAVDTLACSATPKAFRSMFMNRLDAFAAQHEGIDMQPEKYIRDYLRHEAHWLKRPDAYAHLRMLAQQDRIACGVMDVLDTGTAASQLGDAIRTTGHHVDTAYWSNIGQFVAPYEKIPRPETLSDLMAAGRSYTGDKGLFADGVLQYGTEYFCDYSPAKGPKRWNGSESKRMLEWGPISIGRARPRRSDELPPYERMLRNISVLGGERTLHMMTSNVADMSPLAMLINEDLGCYHGIPHYFEGPPRLTPDKWAAREKARAEHDKAVREGRDIY